MGKILLPIVQPSEYTSYGFRFKGDHLERVTGIYSLGWEKQTSKTYDWDGLTRNESNLFVFQYTVRGKGEIRIHNKTYSLKPGDAFFVKIPSDHRYYLPEQSEEWEFVHLTLFGGEANHFYEHITREAGHIFKLDHNEKPVSIIFNLFEKASKYQINDAYEVSSYAYSFLMEFNRYVFNIGKNEKEWPKSISKAVNFINHNYQQPIGLDEIVVASGLSKYHFTRLFHESTNTTPIQYLTKVRINKAMELLRNQELSVEQVAQQVGFANGNYFSKVFRSYLGTSPGNFRSGSTIEWII